MKRNLLLPIIFSQAFMAQAQVSQTVQPEDAVKGKIDQVTKVVDEKLASLNDRLQALCPEGKQVNLEEVGKQSNKIWKEITKQINNARIDYGIKERAEFLDDRISVGIGKKAISETSIGGKYSGVDKWTLDLYASPIDYVGVYTKREVTFIQQFENRCKSLVRLAYDPITKIPSTSERALKRLKPGDFVAFSSPLTVSIGQSFLERSNDLRGLAGLSVYASGEFNIHVYRMEDNMVRVRLFAAQTRGAGFSAGLKLYGILGTSLRVFDANISQSATKLFSADYVFNLNDAQSRKLYDQALGQKFDLTKVAFHSINPLVKENSVKDALFSDLDAIEAVSVQDANKDLNSRRVIRLAQGDTDITSNHVGFSFNLRLIKADNKLTMSKGEISLFNSENQLKNYLIDTISHKQSYDLFKVWGQEDAHNTAMLTQADSNFRPVALTGLQTIRVKEELAFSRDEIQTFQDRLTSRLPKEIAAILKFPDLSKLKTGVSNARIEQSLFIDAQALQAQGSITNSSVRAELTRLILASGNLASKPMDLSPSYSAENQDPRAEAWKEANKLANDRQYDKAASYYLEAYQQELGLIPTYIGRILEPDTANNMQQKLKDYESLQTIPLYKELGTFLVLNLIGQSDKAGRSTVTMKDIVSYRLSITARGIEPKVSEYPEINVADKSSSDNLRKSDIFRRIIDDNAYLSDRSFNLRYYMNDNGDSLSLKEVVARSK